MAGKQIIVVLDSLIVILWHVILRDYYSYTAFYKRFYKTFLADLKIHRQ